MLYYFIGNESRIEVEIEIEAEAVFYNLFCLVDHLNSLYYLDLFLSLHGRLRGLFYLRLILFLHILLYLRWLFILWKLFWWHLMYEDTHWLFERALAQDEILANFSLILIVFLLQVHVAVVLSTSCAKLALAHLI